MTDVISPSDPSSSLWQKVQAEQLAAIGDLLGEAPVPIGQIAEKLGLEIVSLTLPYDISGLIKRVSDNPARYQIQINNTDAPVRQRFTVAHEIGHFLLHIGEIDSDGITDSILYRSKLSDKKEAEANRLAAAMLLPWDKVKAWHQSRFGCDPVVANIDEIAKAFKVSSLAVGFRLRF